jgi:hypothetical protein
MGNERIATRIFTWAGIYGLIVLLPMYVLKDWLGQQAPPAITHDEFYYGFIGVAVAWQVAFLVIGSDPARYRTLMLPAILEKLSYGIAAVVLFSLDRLAGSMFAGAVIDLALATAFATAYRMTRPASSAPL